MASCNQNDELFASLDKAVLFLEKGAPIKGNQEIANYYIKNNQSMTKIMNINIPRF